MLPKNKTYNIKNSNRTLEKVSEGPPCEQTAIIVNAGVYTTLDTEIKAISCCVASAVCNPKASTAMSASDTDKSLRYSNAAKYLSISCAYLGATGTTQQPP